MLSSSNVAEEPIVIEKEKVNLYLVMDIKKNEGSGEEEVIILILSRDVKSIASINII